ncbi:MAG: DUF4907 domain-containing protein [Bacteroidota bacterium]
MAFFGQISQIRAQDTGKAGSMPTAEQLAKANLTFKVIETEGGGYGYDVLADGKRLIHQTTIPGQPGILGFKRRSDSEKVAKLVIRKLKNREIPPAVTESELRELKVID